MTEVCCRDVLVRVERDTTNPAMAVFADTPAKPYLVASQHFAASRTAVKDQNWAGMAPPVACLGFAVSLTSACRFDSAESADTPDQLAMYPYHLVQTYPVSSAAAAAAAVAYRFVACSVDSALAVAVDTTLVASGSYRPRYAVEWTAYPDVHPLLPSARDSA